MSYTRALGYFLLGLSIFIVDRLSKYIVLHEGVQFEPSEGFISCSLAFNRGISWGMLNNNDPITFLIITFFVSAIVVALLYYTIRSYYSGAQIIGNVLVIAGALSNLVDRISYHAVIDFISVCLFGFAMPIFNVADTAIVIGALLMLYQGLRA